MGVLPGQGHPRAPVQGAGAPARSRAGRARRHHAEGSADQVQELRAKFADEEKRYNAEKLEHERDRNKAKDPNFDFAESLLQIAIVIASVSILSTSRALYGVSLVFAAIGVLLCGNGYLLLT